MGKLEAHPENRLQRVKQKMWINLSLKFSNKSDFKAFCSRDVAEMMSERGLNLSHTTIMRWVHEFGLEIDKRIRPFLKPANDSYRVDETYIKVKGQWKYLYRAVDSMGHTIDFMLSAHRDVHAAKTIFYKGNIFASQSVAARNHGG